MDEAKVIKIQKWYRGCLVRLKQLPPKKPNEQNIES